MTQEKLPHRKELCLQSEAKAYAFAFTFIRIEKVGNKELERIHTMVLSLQLLPFLSLRTGTHRYRQKQSLQRSVSAVPG